MTPCNELVEGWRRSALRFSGARIRQGRPGVAGVCGNVRARWCPLLRRVCSMRLKWMFVAVMVVGAAGCVSSGSDSADKQVCDFAGEAVAAFVNGNTDVAIARMLKVEPLLGSIERESIATGAAGSTQAARAAERLNDETERFAMLVTHPAWTSLDKACIREGLI